MNTPYEEVDTEIVAKIANKFDVLNKIIPNKIRNITKSHPSPGNILFGFDHLGVKYYLLEDAAAKDDPAYIQVEIEKTHRNLTGSLCEPVANGDTVWGADGT